MKITRALLFGPAYETLALTTEARKYPLTLNSIDYFRSWYHFLFLDNIEKIKKKLSKIRIYHNIFKYVVLQRHQKALG